ncbi:MAG: putative lipid II flippase FtsW [Thermodesulfobacteriota bacterium]|nr:putative lipid II flippase FtsW [Thermodesulfobacteriota bacterium]
MKQKTNILPHNAEQSLLFITFILVGIGIIMVYCASAFIASTKFHDSAYFLKHQMVYGIFGIIVMWGVSKIDTAYYRISAYPLLITSCILLVLVLIPSIGLKFGGSRRWLSLASITFQPSEIAKFATILYLAYSLAKKEDTIKKFTIGILPHILVMILMALLILSEPDLGCVIMIFAVTITMLFISGTRISHIIFLLVCALPCVFYQLITVSYRLDRVNAFIYAFINPWKHAKDIGYQLLQSLIAVGSGGITGKGLGNGTQKLFYLPEPHTDFIFAIVGEEVGWVGSTLLVFLFALFGFLGTKIALKAQDLFNTYLAFGITSLIIIQAFTHFGVTLGLLPTTGITLPFISYGGTSLVMNLFFVGILLSISRSSTRR